MPNSKCKKCSCYLDDIIKTKEDKIRFVKLLHKRLKKFLGVPYNISPGIRHNEIIKDKKNNKEICEGYLNYEPFTRSPKNFKEFDFNELLSDFNLDEIIDKIKKGK